MHRAACWIRTWACKELNATSGALQHACSPSKLQPSASDFSLGTTTAMMGIGGRLRDWRQGGTYVKRKNTRKNTCVTCSRHLAGRGVHVVK